MYNEISKQAYIVNGGKVKESKITALLCRLSKEDELRGDSESIQTQKKMLLRLKILLVKVILFVSYQEEIIQI